MTRLNLLRSGLTALVMLVALILLPGHAHAQQYGATNTMPKIEGFDVEPVKRLSAGSELLFTLYGTPGGTASVRINSVTRRIFLDEVETGIYEGAYTIKKNDRLVADTTVTANLRVGNQIASELLDASMLAGARSASRRTVDASALPVIETFDVDPVNRLLPGEQLFFNLHGTPAAKASIHIAGVKGKLVMQEVQSGAYEGSYTVTDRDRLAYDAVVTATLQLGGNEVSATLGRSLLSGSNTIPSARRAIKFCANCGVIEAVNLIEVQGDGGYLGKIAGGLVGGLLGSQVGQGRGTTAAEIAGVVGGVVVGNEIEKRSKKTTHYDVIARLQGGGSQTVTYATAPSFRVGDKIRVENGALVADQ